MDMPYYVIGYSLEAERFFRQLILLFAVHRTSTSMFQFLAAVCQTLGAAMTAGGFAVLIVLLFCGFVITHSSNAWVVEVSFLVSPLSYGEIGLSVNEFLTPRWQKKLPTNSTIGTQIHESHGLDFDEYYFWIALGALFGFALLFNMGFILALSFLTPPGSSLQEKLAKIQGSQDSNEGKLVEEKSKNSAMKGGMVLLFEPPYR
ncbi:pleiotropic drug resistance protein 3-like isoform X2 [Pistacia vera]|uniref:pleiotropic drug resistance protein 3-like isoform X2 n=1 Tax=Pistacia vera TaxID=55513 RepID=UPI0012633C5D|nr:pleiotropic drug resistance protein 3-like isoform X2 [Pistacia vera]